MTVQTQLPATVKSGLIAQSEGARGVGFDGASDFALLQRVGEMFSQSQLVPAQYQGPKGMANCMIAVELSNRLGVSWLAVMQNLYVVHGRPAWMATFVIATINGCGRFNSLRFDITGQGDSRQCIAWTTEKEVKIPANVRTLADAIKANLPVLESAPITWAMVRAEGWDKKPGSKWLTMPDQMFRYRAAAFWGRTYAPELLMGIMTAEEANDVGDAQAQERAERVKARLINGNGAGHVIASQPASSEETIDAEVDGEIKNETPQQPPAESGPSPLEKLHIEIAEHFERIGTSQKVRATMLAVHNAKKIADLTEPQAALLVADLAKVSDSQ